MKKKKKCSEVSLRKLSPNEEAQLMKDEVHRRRKLRIQQVREQERYIAQQLRRQVQERREMQLHILADKLQHEWQQEQTHKLQSLSRAYEESLQTVGHAHRSAHDNECNSDAVARRSVERLERAADRHRKALRDLTARRHEEQQQSIQHIEARKKALQEEKKRALRVAGLPPPPPNILESIGLKTRLALKSSPAEHFSVTHHHMAETALDRETETLQMDARQAAEEEVQRLEEIERKEACDRLEKLDKARVRGNHALKKEQDTQNRTRLLGELERLQQADLLRRRQAVDHIPAQIFQPLYRQEELRNEQQRDLEIAFHDMYTKECKVRGDLGLQLVPEPLPHPSDDSHVDLDMTPEENTVNETPEPSGDPARHALRRLLDRIRNRQSTAVEVMSAGNDVTDVWSVETGTFGSPEGEQAGSIEEQTPTIIQDDDVPEVSDEPIVAGMIPLTEEQTHVTESKKGEYIKQETHEAVLLSQQQEQLILLEELEEKRQELERRLKEAQQERLKLEDAAQVHSGINDVKPVPDPAPEITGVETHTQRLHQYQQRLLEQNRRHKKCVEDARRRLEEYQHTLRLRHVIGISTAAQTLQALHPPDIRRHVHPSCPQQDTCQTQSQAFLSPASDSSDVIQSEVSLQCSEDKISTEMSHDVCVSDHGQVPLPPPSVVLELLRSRQHRGDMSMPSFNTTSAVQTPAQAKEEAEPDRQHGGAMSSVDEFNVINTLLKSMKQSSGHSEPLCQRSSLPVSNGFEQAVPVSRGKVKPPVSRPPARLAFLQQMEAHELSAIQEVDTPVNISLDAEVSESSSMSLPAFVSDGNASERSKVTEGVSRMSWREALLIHSNSSVSSTNQQSQFDVTLTPDRSAVDAECLSSTTVSTGSFSSSEHECNDTISNSSLLHVEPVGKENSVFRPSPKSTSCQSQAIKDSIQKIIDKYKTDLDASLRTSGVHTGGSISQSWSSVLNQGLSHDDTCERRSSAVDLSNAEITGDFLPLKPHPDIDSSSSSSSSRNLMRNEGDSRTQSKEAVNRIIEHFSEQLPIRRSDRGQMTGESSSISKDLVQASSLSQSQSSVMSVQNILVNVRTNNSTSPQADESDSAACGSVLNQMIGRVSDIGSSQILDDSNAPGGGLMQMALQQTVGGGGLSLSSESDRGSSNIRSSVLQCSEDDVNVFAEASHDDTSDGFLPLPTEVTHNESLERSLVAHIPLIAETCHMNMSTSASDCLETTDSSLPSFTFDTSLHQLRSDTQTQSTSNLHISIEQLSVSHDSLGRTDEVAPPTASDISRIPFCPSLISTRSADESTLDRLLVRVQEVGDEKGILEESTISFISLPESTSQDPDVTGEQSEEKESCDVNEGSSPSDNPESSSSSSSSHAVMMLEFQSASVRQQEKLVKKKHHLAQRSVQRAADVKAKAEEMRRMTEVIQKPDSCVKKPVCRSKSLDEMKDVTPEQKCLEEMEMYKRTQRLYNRLEEVKQKKEIHSRQKAHAKNREKAKEFQRKTLEKLRSKQSK